MVEFSLRYFGILGIIGWLRLFFGFLKLSYNEKLNEVRDVTSDISGDEKPKVYLAFWGELTYTPAVYEPVEVAGGESVAEEGAPGPYGAVMWQVSKEQIIAWNPDVILLHCVGAVGSLTIEDVLSDPDLESVSAVQNGKVYSQ